MVRGFSPLQNRLPRPGGQLQMLTCLVSDRPTIVIGDGRSDFCMAERADFVIAKSRLAEHCRIRGIRHAPFVDFHQVIDQLAAWHSRRYLTHANACHSPLIGNLSSRREVGVT